MLVASCSTIHTKAHFEKHMIITTIILLLVFVFSTGVGRAGVFIALDNLLCQFKDGNYIDVFGTVHEMRTNRMAMVQTEVREQT